MPFDVSRTNQSTDVENWIKAKMYQSAYETAAESKASKNGMRFSGFGIGFVSGNLTILKRIGRIFESVLKGMLNILGSPCFDQCCFLTGVKQLTWDLGLQSVRLVFSIITAVVKLFFKTIAIMVRPKKYLKTLWHEHDPAAKQIEKEKIKTGQFNAALNALTANPQDVSLIRKVGDCHLKGHGTPIDRDEAIKMYKEAAGLGDPNAMKILGDIYSLDQRQTSLKWYKKAAKLKNLDARYALGLHFYNGGQGDIIRAEKYFKAAERHGHDESKSMLDRIEEDKRNRAANVRRSPAHVVLGTSS